MSEKVDCVIKSGIVESIGDGYINVQIHNDSACSTCYSKGACTSMGSGDRIIEVEFDKTKEVLPGDKVDIEMVSSQGWIAVLVGYIIPFILLITTLLIVSNYTGEATSALVALGVLVPYYSILFMVRNKMKKYFRFTLK